MHFKLGSFFKDHFFSSKISAGTDAEKVASLQDKTFKVDTREFPSRLGDRDESVPYFP